MRRALIGFAAGVMLAHGQPVAPFAAIIIGVAGAILLASRPWRFAAALAIGAAWGWLAIAAALPDRPSDCPVPVALSAHIAGLPERQGPMASFEVILAADAACGLKRGDRMRLSWTHTGQPLPLPRPGQQWGLTARIRPARATANPHAFDYERWLTRQRIIATGYVVAGQLTFDTRHPVDDFRLRLRERIESLELAHGGMVLALATGDGALLPPAAWARLRETATVHLFVISGLHIGMFAALGMAFGNLLTRATPLTRRFRARGIAAGFAIGTALAYATLAGWTLPVTRAATMAAIAALAVSVGRRLAPSTGLVTALALVLAIDPMAPLDTGFWLSFLAVGALVAFFAPRVGEARRGALPQGGTGRGRRWTARAGALVLAQMVVSVAFAPAMGAFVGHFHPLAPLLNLALIPIVTLAAAPLSAGGALLLPWLPMLAEPLLVAADITLGVVIGIVELAAATAPVAIDPRPATLAAAAALAVAFLLPWPWASRAAIATATFMVMTRAAPTPASGFEVVTLDVGQGTAVLVRTTNHALLYDAGARYPSGFDVGDAIVAPYVRQAHGRGVTLLVLSHADIDHVGGASAVLRNLSVRSVSVGEPVAGIVARPCRRGDAWLWDGVWFRTLSPDRRHDGNNASCVIEVAHGERRALLTGDIDSSLEVTLPVHPVDVLIAPHHGSRTSSTRAFVNRARPRFVIVSAGHGNRFGHPHPEVVERYRAVGSHIASTSALGAIEWRSAAPESLQVARDDWRYWRRDGRRMAQ